jgi:hypothetical protein
MTDDSGNPTPEDYRDLFEVDRRGARILEHLARMFVKNPVTDGGIDAVLKTFTYAGQRKPLDFIVNQINRANGVQEGES